MINKFYYALVADRSGKWPRLKKANGDYGSAKLFLTRKAAIAHLPKIKPEENQVWHLAKIERTFSICTSVSTIVEVS